MVLRVALVLMALTMVAIAAGCSDGGGELTVEQVYGRVLEGMTQEDEIFHSTMSFEVAEADGTTAASGIKEFWIDVPGETYMYRKELIYSESEAFPDVSVYLYRDGELVSAGDSGQVVPSHTSCAGSDSAILSQLLGCEDMAIFQDDREVRAGVSFDSRDALVIQNGDVEGPTSWGLYLDSKSYLPIARVLEASGSEAGLLHLYTNEFVPRESLPTDFFDPDAEVEGAGP